MITCSICKKEFPFQWKLNRHLNRKTPCKNDQNCQIRNQNCQIKDQNYQNKKQNCQNILKQNGYQFNIGLKGNIEKEQCIYCLKKFKRLNVHRKTCKEQFDETRKFEIELDILFNVNKETYECRFCNKLYCNQAYLNIHITGCKKKKEYRELLKQIIKNVEGKSDKNKQIVINVINNTNFYFQNNKLYVNNGIEVRPFGKESLKHLTNEKVNNLLGESKEINETKPEIKFISLLLEEIHRNENVPENYNIEYVNKRTDEMIVYTAKNKLEKKIFSDAYYYFKRVHTLSMNYLISVNIAEEYKLILVRVIRLIDLMKKKYSNETNEDEISKNDRKQMNEINQYMKMVLHGNGLISSTN